MKIIVTGSTGFVATEVIRQALSNPIITSITALARRPTAVPRNAGPDADPTKLKSIVCEDFEKYSEDVKKELAGADACIWLLAVTPSKARNMGLEKARKFCLDYTVAGIKTIIQLPREAGCKPLRFIYTSGANSERDQSKKPWIIGDYCLMRGEVETRVISLAKESKGAMEACVTKPGLIDAPGRFGMIMNVARTVGCTIIGVPKVEVAEIAATLINQAVNGIEKETLLNEDLIRIGQQVLADQQHDL